MPQSVMSSCGASVMVPSMGEVGSVDDATITSAGVVKMAIPVEDVTVVTVTDVDSAAQAIAAMGTTLSELMQSLRNAGILAVSDNP